MISFLKTFILKFLGIQHKDDYLGAISPFRPSQGGTGTAINPTAGQILVGQSNGLYLPTNPSSSGFLTSINTDTTAAQTLTVGTTGTDFAIVDNGVGGHAFNLPSASATARGVITTGTQTLAGVKSFSDDTNFNGRAIVNSGGLLVGSTGFAGAVAIFPVSASKGWTSYTASDNSAGTVTNVNTALQTGARTYTIPDAGASASFVMTEGTQTINGITTFGSRLLSAYGYTAGANGVSGGDIILYNPGLNKGWTEFLGANNNTGNTVTYISAASQAGTRTYTIPDALASASFVMSEGASTINGVKTFGTPIALNSGGTANSLTASNGGVVYSDASGLQILAGTAQNRQLLMSGSSAAPVWTTAIWPATTTVNQILYSSATNSVAGLASANSGVLVTGVTGIPSISSTLPNIALGTPTSGVMTNVTGTAAGLTAGNVTTNANLTGPITSVGNATTVANSINLPANPTTTTQTPADNSTKIATTAYVDNAVLGQRQKEAVKYASIAALPTVVYANGSSGVGATITAFAFGALSLDSNAPSVADRVLIKNQVSDFQNGIYVVTAVGSVGALFILTRATDFDQASDIQTGDTVFVTAGNTLTATTWAYNGIDSPTMGTTSLTFVQSAGPGVNTAGNGITITGASIAIDTSVTVDKTTAQTLTNKTLTSPILTTPALGTPTALVGTNITGTGASFTAGNATNVGITDDTSTAATMYPTWVTAATGNLPQKVSSTGLTWNPSTGVYSIGSNGKYGELDIFSSTTNKGKLRIYTGDNSGNTSTILQFAGQSGTRIYNVSDVGASADFVMTEGAQTVNGTKTFGTAIAIGSGGTGQTTKAAAFDALSPMTTGGDLIYGGASGTGTRLANGTAGQILQSNGTTTAPTWVTSGTVAGAPYTLCQGRLTLTTNNPIVDTATSTSVYFTPYKGDQIGLYDGANWAVYTLTNLTLAIGTVTAYLPYDVFIYNNSGTLTLEALAWTNATTRATALVMQNGILSKTGVLTRRYLGTFVPYSTTQCRDIPQSRLLFNYYNRVQRIVRVVETAATWNYTTATWRPANANANALSWVEYINGYSEDGIDLILIVGTGQTATAARGSAFQINSSNTTSPTTVDSTKGTSSGYAQAGRGTNTAVLTDNTLGYFVYWNMEYSAAGAGTTTWVGDNSAAAQGQISILKGVIFS